MTYKIRPEFLDRWGSDANENTILTEAEIERLSHDWDIATEDLMKQLYPNTPAETAWHTANKEDNTMEKTLYTAVIETEEGIHLIRKEIADPTAEYEDFEEAMNNKADDLDGELLIIYAPEDIVEDVTI